MMVRFHISRDSPLELLLQVKIKMASHINSDFILLLHQLQEITVMVRPFHFVSRDSSTMTKKAMRLKVSAPTTSATSKKVKMSRSLDQSVRPCYSPRIPMQISSCSPLALVSLHSDPSSGDSSSKNTLTTSSTERPGSSW